MLALRKPPRVPRLHHKPSKSGLEKTPPGKQQTTAAEQTQAAGLTLAYTCDFFPFCPPGSRLVYSLTDTITDSFQATSEHLFSIIVKFFVERVQSASAQVIPLAKAAG